MELPAFEKFIYSLSDEKVQKILQDAKLKCDEMSEFGSGDQILGISWTISLELLALYHLWLQESSPGD